MDRVCGCIAGEAGHRLLTSTRPTRHSSVQMRGVKSRSQGGRVEEVAAVVQHISALTALAILRCVGSWLAARLVTRMHLIQGRRKLLC